MRRLLILLMLIVPFIAEGQQRVCVYAGGYDDDIFVINHGSDETPDLEILFLQGVVSHTDSTFISIREDQIGEFRNYLEQVYAQFQDWSSVAKKNRIAKYEKPFDAISPEVHLVWTQRSARDLRWPSGQIGTFRSDRRYSLPMKFFVTSEGVYHIAAAFRVPDDTDSVSRRIYISWNRKRINFMKSWLDRDKLHRAYVKHRPKLTDEQIDALFK